MYIKCWGSRGSIPVSGNEYIKYGGDTTCIEIRTKDDKIIKRRQNHYSGCRYWNSEAWKPVDQRGTIHV